EEPAGGPNYFKFDDNVVYNINIDNVGDAQPHIQYQFKFNTQIGNPNTFLYNTGPIESIDSPNWNVKQFYGVTRFDDGKPTVVGDKLKAPPVNVGAKSTPNYEALSNAAIQDLGDGNGKVFAGQADDPFFVDLNVFDLLTIRKLPGNMGGGVDGLKGYNVQSIAIQVPMSKLAKGGTKPAGPGDANAVIGVWSTTARQATKVLSGGGKSQTSGDYVQVSRLGNPLVNEVVAPLGAKDLFNNSKPQDDAQFLPAVVDPELAKLFTALYKIKVPPAPRDDLVAIFLTGIPGATQPPTSTLKPSEELRLNMGVPVTAPDKVSNLGVVGGDLQGFPDGRRLADDVTDIELKAVAGAAYPLFHKDFVADPLAAQLGDGVDANDVPFRTSFPYVALAHDGTSSVPHANVQTGGGGNAQPTAQPTAQQPQPAPTTGSAATAQPAPTTGTQPVPTTAANNPPSAPPATNNPPSSPPVGMAPPGMPKTGGFEIDHLGDIYGTIFGIAAGLGGLVLLSGYAMRRKTASEDNK
ncbi:MAG: DUF4331 family protein, partial [Chloroflexota bacterium]|nr:DUF4331 family protein [Chloroflexota bacterium]